MAEKTDKLAELIKQFRALKTHEEKCAFLHHADNYQHLGAIYSVAHYPKPAAKTEETTKTK